MLVDLVEHFQGVSVGIPNRLEKGFEIRIDSTIARRAYEFLRAKPLLGSIPLEQIGILSDWIPCIPTMDWLLALNGAFRMHEHLLMGALDAIELDWISETVKARGTIFRIGLDFDRCMQQPLTWRFAGTQMELVVAK